MSRPSNEQAFGYIPFHLVDIGVSVHITPQCDPLFQLPQIRLIQFFPKFRLARQNDLQVLGIIRFKIQQQSDLFQHIVRKFVSFVDDYYRAKSASMALVEHLSHQTE